MFALVLLPSIVTLAPRAATLPGPYAVTDLGTGQIVRSSGRTDPDTVDDEPRVKISSVSKNEGNNGTTSFAFPLTLSAASDAAVTVNFVTADGYARAPEDYEAKSGSLDFAAGTTSKTITVNVKGDRTREWDEVFYVNLSGAAGAVIQAGQGTGVVRNDDDR